MKFKLEDFPPAVQDKIRLQLGQQPAAQPVKAPPLVERVKSPKKMTATEQEYNRAFLAGAGVFEAVSLKLPGGSRYTPDFVTVNHVTMRHPERFDMAIEFDVVTVHEVKGSYRLGSHGRALTAFREAAAAFPFFRFVWAAKRPDGTWNITRHNEGQ